jgi:hypothetical protein
MSAAANAQPWTHVKSEGVINNPSGADVLLADTGIQGPGTYEVRALIGADAQTAVKIQHRNATNDGNIGVVQTVYVGPNSGMYLFAFTLAASERVRAVTLASLTGNISVSLQIRNM